METDVKKEAPSMVEAVNTEAPKEEVVTTTSVVNEKPKGKGLSTVLIVLLVLALLGGAAYAGYYFANSQPASEEESSSDTPDQDGEEEDQDGEEEEAVELTSDFEGDYITAEIPEGWSIVEYADGAGSDMLMDADYQGLTGLSVLTDEDVEVLKVYAVMGIGGIDICSDVGRFSDTPQAYINTINALTTDYNLNSDPDEAMPIVYVIGDAEYTESTFIDYRVRRVDTDLYFNDLDNANADEFHALCGLAAGVLSFDTLTFEYDSGMGSDTSGSYSVKIMGEPTEETLLLLDELMSSITLN
jgi:hypothetical protein